MDHIRGFVTKAGGSKTFFVAETLYEGPKGLTKAKVTAPGARFQVGDYFVADGDWGPEDARFSKGGGKPRIIFKAKAMRPELPQDAETARRWFLEIFSPHEHGVTEESAKSFVAKHGAGAALLCERNPELVVGLSAEPGRFRAALARDWGRRISGRRAVTLLESCNVPSPVIAAIIAALRDEAFDAIRENPYRVASIKNVGFKNADLVGSGIGISPEDARRISAALAEVLDEVASSGHTYAPAALIGEMMASKFGIEVPVVARYLTNPARREDSPIAIEMTPKGYIGQPKTLRDAEAVVADWVVRRLSHGRRNPEAEIDAAIAELCANPPFSKFDSVQRMGVALCSREPVSILTGGPGTGKSAVSKLAVKVAERFESNILLCAPTGKAAKRLSETTGRDATTVHRMLGAVEDKANSSTTFRHNRANPLPAGCLVLVDEASMIDAVTMRALVDAIPPDGRLMLVGDDNQLPSVDAGAVLADLLRAEAAGRRLVPQTKLVNIYRQGRDSRIAKGSVLVRDGNLPVLTSEIGSGLALTEVANERIGDCVEWMVRRFLDVDGPVPMGPNDIMVLSPQRKGPAGTWALNRRLAALVNPGGAAIPGVSLTPDEAKDGVPLPRVGDRVMLTENDSENDVMNGDIGVVEAGVQMEDARGFRKPGIRVAFDCGKTVVYPASKWRQLQLAYAITVHKSQGSQYPVVIMPVSEDHQMLDRSLVYTGWTRAERFLCLVGGRDALQAGVERTDSSRRDTRLASFCADVAARIGYVPPVVPIPPSEDPVAEGSARPAPGPAPRVLSSAVPIAASVPPPPPPLAAAGPRPRVLSSSRPRAPGDAVPAAPPPDAGTASGASAPTAILPRRIPGAAPRTDPAPAPSAPAVQAFPPARSGIVPRRVPGAMPRGDAAPVSPGTAALPPLAAAPPSPPTAAAPVPASRPAPRRIASAAPAPPPAAAVPAARVPGARVPGAAAPPPAPGSAPPAPRVLPRPRVARQLPTERVEEEVGPSWPAP